MPWLGVKRIAFIPVDRGRWNESPQGQPGFPVPADWREQIERRIYFDRDPITGLNVSLRDYIYTTSQGRADLEGVVLDVVQVDEKTYRRRSLRRSSSNSYELTASTLARW